MDLVWLPFLKHVHVTTVVLSLCGFLVRACWMWRRPKKLAKRWVRTLPHVNDTLLLLSAVSMLLILKISPVDHAWLAAKLLALSAYIVLGGVALRYGPTLPIRLASGAAAVTTFGYIVAVALSKQVLPWA